MGGRIGFKWGELISGVSEGMWLGLRARIALLLFVSSSRVCVMVMELL